MCECVCVKGWSSAQKREVKTSWIAGRGGGSCPCGPKLYAMLPA